MSMMIRALPRRLDNNLFPVPRHRQDLGRSDSGSCRTRQVKCAIGIFGPVVVVVSEDCGVSIEALCQPRQCLRLSYS
jgi:hypothetical protein